MKKVVLLGKGELAIRIGEWFLNSESHEIVYVIPTIPEPEWTKSLITWAKLNNIPYAESGHYEDFTAFEGANLFFSVFYSKIIKKGFIEKCEKIVNLHNSPLPKYRGVSPINWALKDKQEEHGVTIHEILPGVDDGPIIGQAKYSIYPEFEEVIDVYNKAIDFGYTLFKNTINLIDKIKPRPQDKTDIIYHHSKENYLLGERRFFTIKESREKLIKMEKSQ